VGQKVSSRLSSAEPSHMTTCGHGGVTSGSNVMASGTARAARGRALRRAGKDGARGAVAGRGPVAGRARWQSSGGPRIGRQHQTTRHMATSFSMLLAQCVAMGHYSYLST
jgi:hypothetical protein